MKALLLAIIALFVAPPAEGAVSYRETFDAPTVDYIARDGCPTDHYMLKWLCFNPGNVWQAGGALHVRQSAGTLGRPYDGGEAATCRIGYGWPCKDVTLSWAPPVRLEAGIRFSGRDRFWQAFTAWSVNKADPTEFDIAEMRGQKERFQFCAVHDGIHIHLGRKLPFDITRKVHRYWMDLHRHRVTFGVGRLVCGTTHLPHSPGPVAISFVGKSGDFPWAGGAVKGSPSYEIAYVRALKP